jgi:hypothetical protein
VKDSDRADQRVVLDHRHDEQCPRPAELDACNGQRITLDIGLIRTIAGDVDGLARFDEPAQRVERTRPIRPAPEDVTAHTVPLKKRDTTWVEPRFDAEITYSEITNDGVCSR